MKHTIQNLIPRLAGILLIAAIQTSSAAILVLEDFSSDIGVSSRDGEMTVTYDGGNDWMSGSFALQGFPVPQTDAFVVDSADFTGDYVTPGITQIQLQMYAVNILPSDLFIRLVDGTNTFSHQFTPLAGMFQNWQTFTADLVWSAGWNGPSEVAFNSALLSVDQIEIQLTRNSGIAQTYYFDNLQTLDTELDPGDVETAIPESRTLSMLLLSVILISLVRRNRIRTSAAP